MKNNNNNNNSKEEILSSLSNKKRGNGEIIDLNTILSLGTKKKKLTEKQKLKQEAAELTISNKEDSALNTSKPIKWDEIQVDKLDSYLLDELSFIAKSVGIATTGVRKYDLKNKIKFIIKVNKEAIENKLLKDNSNPFNKTSFTELVITDGQDGVNELLFWKVFKNKSIFKRIMLSMNEYPNRIPYEYYISVSKILYNNQVEVLKDKVKRNQYLSFKEYYKDYNKPFSVWIKIFTLIQDDKEFYKSLFANYKVDVPFNEKYRFTTSAKLLSQTNCLIGLQVLIEDHDYIPTLEVLKIAFNYISIDCIKLMLSVIPETELILDVVPPNKKKQQKLQQPSVFQICSFFPKISQNVSKIGKTIKCIKLFIETFKIPKEQVYLHRLFSGSSVELRLKDLIKWIGLLDSLDLWSEYKNSKFKFSQIFRPKKLGTKTTEKQPKTIAIDQIRSEMKSYKFSNEQLKSKLNDPINYKSNEKENIKKLFYIYNIVSGSDGSAIDACFTAGQKLAEYYICYGSDQVGNGTYDYSKVIGSTVTNKHKNYEIVKYALEYCHIASLKNWLTSYYHYTDYQSSENDDSPYYHNHTNPNGKDIFFNLLNGIRDQFGVIAGDISDLLFSKCKNRELQIQFINSIIDDIKCDQVASNFKLSPMFVFMILVSIDDLELVQLLVSKLGKDSITIQLVLNNQYVSNVQNICLLHSITKYIKSTEMLDYIFTEFPILISRHSISTNSPSVYHYTSTPLVDHSDSVRCQISDLKLLKHYQQLIDNNQHLAQFFNKFIWVNITNPSVKLIQHVLNNTSTYRHYKQLLLIRPCDFEESLENQEIYFTSLKNHVITNCQSTTAAAATDGIQFDPLLLYSSPQKLDNLRYPSRIKIEFIRWLINFKSNSGTDGEEFIKKYLYNPRNSRSVYYEKLIHYFIYGGDDKLFDEKVTASFIINWYNGFQEIVKFAITRGDLQTLDRILGILLDRLEEIPTPPLNRIYVYNTTDDEKEYILIKSFILERILSMAIASDQLLILKYLYLNYSQIFKKRITSTIKNNNNNTNDTNDNLFVQVELSSLVCTSLKSYNVKLSEFLLSLVSFSKDTFKKVACESSKNHFKNRF